MFFLLCYFYIISWQVFPLLQMLRSDFPRSFVLPPCISLSSALFSNSTKTLEIHGHHHNHLPREFFLVQFLKSSTSSSSLLSGQQAHTLATKSGLDNSNIFVRNALINLYSKLNLFDAAHSLFRSSSNRDVASYNIILSMNVKKGDLDFARKLFDEMPHRDCVSFTTMVMGFCQNNRPMDSLSLFSDMLVAGVSPNEVTLASVIATCSHLKGIATGMGIHGLSVKTGFHSHVLVSTNLVHLYAICLRLSDSEAIFGEMMEKNVVTWNAMLNGYAKSGHVDKARDLFVRIPERDLVSWSTMIDGYLRVDNLEEALYMFVEMLTNLDAKVNEVLLVDLLLACGRFSAFREGRQLHGMILKAGLDSHGFVQDTLIHF